MCVCPAAASIMATLIVYRKLVNVVLRTKVITVCMVLRLESNGPESLCGPWSEVLSVCVAPKARP